MFFGNAGGSASSSGCWRPIRRWSSGFAGWIPRSTAISRRFDSTRPAMSLGDHVRPRPAAACTVIRVQPGRGRRSGGHHRGAAVDLRGRVAGRSIADGCPRRSMIHLVLRPLSSRCCSTRTRRCAESSLPGSIGMHTRPWCGRCERIMSEVMKLAPEARLPLVERAVPALRQMSPAQMREFLDGVKALVEADKKLTIFEYALQRLLLRHLVTYFVKQPPRPARYTSYEPLVAPTNDVLSALARGGQSSPEAAAAAFAAGVKAL